MKYLIILIICFCSSVKSESFEQPVIKSIGYYIAHDTHDTLLLSMRYYDSKGLWYGSYDSYHDQVAYDSLMVMINKNDSIRTSDSTMYIIVRTYWPLENNSRIAQGR